MAALWALSTPYVSYALVQSLEPAPRDPVANKDGQAIVVLSAGITFQAPEYGSRDIVGPPGLVRVRYAAHLHRALKAPVLITGGAPQGTAASEAELMKQVLEQEYQVTVKWLEQRANNTLDSARLSFRLLHSAGIQRVYLVTHAWHMPRAQFAFERSGFQVIPAPTAYTRRLKPTVLDFLPDARALDESRVFFHEVIGIGWYHLRLVIGR